jgi:hypothetical protein
MEQPITYHLGYAAPIGLEARLRPTRPRSADWDRLRLLGYDLPRTDYRPGEVIHATLYYEVSEPLEASHSIFVHLLGAPDNTAAAGSLAGQDDGDPCRGLYPMTSWQPGSVIVGKATIPVSPGTPAGAYELTVGLYNWQTGERTPPAGAPAGQDSISLGRILVGD